MPTWFYRNAALLALFPLLASAAGTAAVRVTNSGAVPITVAGQTIRPFATATISVPAGEAGAFAATATDGFDLSAPASYPSLRAGGTYALRLSTVRGATTFSPVSLPTTSDPAPALTTTVLEGVVENYDSVDDFVSVPKNVYDALAPFIGDGAASRAKIMAAVDARWADKFWVPRKFSTMLGSVERVMDLWNKMGMAEKAGEVGGLVFLGLRDGKSPSEIADIIAKTKTLMPDDFGTSGELGFYLGRMVAGVVSGQSFATIADDLVDFENPDRLGFWGKVGAGLGFLAADAVIGIEKLLNRGEKARLEQRMIESLRKAGYGEKAERAFRAWLSLDDNLRARTPFRLKDEWKVLRNTPVDKPAAPSTGGFHVNRAPADQADLVVWLNKGDGTITPNDNFSFGFLKFSLLNRTKKHIERCVVHVSFKVGTGQNVVFRDIPPGESRPAEENYLVIGRLVSVDLFKAHPFLFPGLVLVKEGNRSTDLYETGDCPTIGYLPLSDGEENQTEGDEK